MSFFARQDAGILTAPLLRSGDILVFPGTSAPLFLDSEKDLQIVQAALNGDRKLVLDLPLEAVDTENQLAAVQSPRIASQVKILQLMRLPNKKGRAIVEGIHRIAVLETLEVEGLSSVRFQILQQDNTVNDRIAALVRSLQDSVEEYAKLNTRIPHELIRTIRDIDNPNRLVDQTIALIPSRIQEKKPIFAMQNTELRIEATIQLFETEREIFGLRKAISDRVKKKLDKGQREYYLNEQIKELNREMGREEDASSELAVLEERFAKKGLPEQARSTFKAELKRLARLGTSSPEAGILRSYLETILDLPWPQSLTSEEQSVDRQKNDSVEAIPSMAQAAQILDENHYALKEVKDRILEYLAVRTLNPKLRSPILCFVGAPGTGKTSIASAMARAMGKAFVRISLGGLRDEAEIRGHRRTYLGAMPGKVLYGMKKAGKIDPVFLLDEIDKISHDHRGDPASALLEVLDPEQNAHFQDHYLELDYDLSQVCFICTANTLSTIPYPLLDRLEIIEIPGYTEQEKLEIARSFLIPRQLSDLGLGDFSSELSNKLLSRLISDYTMESGVRSLDRQIGKFFRKLARLRLEKGAEAVPEKPAISDLKKYLGPGRARQEDAVSSAGPGIAFGLAWTERGGRLLPVETIVYPGTGELNLTGNLGEVMKESAKIAMSVGNSFLGQEFRDKASKLNVHIHAPEGAVPKDGPSAGITMLVSYLSAARGRKPEIHLAMTGELTLSGRILPVGGIREKVLAAIRSDFRELVLPLANKDDYLGLEKAERAKLRVHFVAKVSELLELLFPDLTQT